MTRPLQTNLYDNVTTLAPDGEAICRCSQEKADWYLAKGLAEVIIPGTIRLNFNPKGRGHAGDLFYLTDKENRCVICGATEQLTRHHICPMTFRRHFPNKVKLHNSHDIVLACIPCHNVYEDYADVLKGQIAYECGVPYCNGSSAFDCGLYKVKRHASALQMYRDRIPVDRQDLLLQTLRDHFNKDDITDADIAEAVKIEPIVKDANYRDFGRRIVEKITDLEEFIIRWRKHFVSTMNPKHMPLHWDINKKVIGLEGMKK